MTIATRRIADMARTLLANTGYGELSLLSLSSADIKGIDAIVQDAIEMFDEDTLTIAMPSTRVDAFNVHLAELVERGRRSGMTFAPEAGTERMREVINKGVSEAETLHAVGLAFARGWQTVKLYFMIGLPGETDADVLGIAETVRWLQRECNSRKRRLRFNITVSNFTPKPHTPFQWHSVSTAEFRRRQQLLREALRPLRGIKTNLPLHIELMRDAAFKIGRAHV